MEKSITLYEAALGLGISSGPLLGGLLGSFYWRDPFFGTSALMATGFILTMILVREPPAREPARRARDVVRALLHKGIRSNALIGLCYNFGFFTVLAYTPLTLVGLTTIELGITYFFWGILVALSSVYLVNLAAARLSYTSIALIALVAMVGIFVGLAIFVRSFGLYLVVLSGIPCGLANAGFTTMAMKVSPFSRSISSGSYNFLRWSGAAVAPILAGYIGQTYGIGIPFAVSAAIMALGIGLLSFRKRMLNQFIIGHSIPVEMAPSLAR